MFHVLSQIWFFNLSINIYLQLNSFNKCYNKYALFVFYHINEKEKHNLKTNMKNENNFIDYFKTFELIWENYKHYFKSYVMAF